jgi:thiamine pyrophosphokinase
MRAAVVFIGGDPPDPRVVDRLPAERFVIAADSGLDHAFALGVTVDLVVGDLDSVSGDALARAEALEIPIERHRPDKDATDTELALDAAVDRGAEHIVVVSAVGDRLDHSLGALLALARPSLGGRLVEAWWGRAHVTAIQGPTQHSIDAPADTLVSLLPLHGAACGITTTGLRYPLRAETLPAGSSRGVSNEVNDPPASVELDRGCLLVVLPTALDHPAQGTRS